MMMQNENANELKKKNGRAKIRRIWEQWKTVCGPSYKIKYVR